jgi:predicted nucleotidyltransferase
MRRHRLLDEDPADEIRALGATSLHLFGSVVRGEAGPEATSICSLIMIPSASTLSN